MSSRQTSTPAHSTEVLQKTHASYWVQLPACQSEQRVQLPTDGSATVSLLCCRPSSALDATDLQVEINNGGLKFRLANARLGMGIQLYAPDRLPALGTDHSLSDSVGATKAKKTTAQSPSRVDPFNMADDDGSSSFRRTDGRTGMFARSVWRRISTAQKVDLARTLPWAARQTGGQRPFSSEAEGDRSAVLSRATVV